MLKNENIKTILATDCGSTTTKAILIEYIDNEYHETNTLLLDISKTKRNLNWQPKWSSAEAIQKTIEWYLNPTDDFTQDQINNFFKIMSDNE